MNLIEDLFNRWNILKQRVNNFEKIRNPKNRDVWLIYLGKNIGHEQNGAGEQFMRPVLVLTRLNKFKFVVLPLTSKPKIGSFYFHSNLWKTVVLGQIKTVDVRRFVKKKGVLGQGEFSQIKEKISELLFGQLAAGPEGKICTNDTTLKTNESSISGLNHLTLAVLDLETSLNFYLNLLGFELKAKWDEGAYLALGQLWLCLSVDKNTLKSPQRWDYTHYGFSVSDKNFKSLVKKLKLAEVTEFKANKSEGDSFYFLDPDGHKLELHVGNLDSRLASLKKNSYKNLTLYS